MDETVEKTVQEAQSWADTIVNTATELVATYGLKVLGAVVALVIGWWIIGALTRLLKKKMTKSGMDESLIPFLGSLVNIILKAALIISVAGIVGIETTSFVAIFGAAGLAIGLALQGGLSNFAAGVMILIFKPYRVGDVVVMQGQVGGIKQIQIFNTIMTNLENNTIIVPNSLAISGIIQNNTMDGELKCVMNIGISYNANIQQAREVIIEVLKKDELIMKEKPMDVFVSALGDSAINLSVRPWCKTEDYWTVRFRNLEAIKVALDNAGISIPFPQMDVHINQLNK